MLYPVFEINGMSIRNKEMKNGFLLSGFQKDVFNNKDFVKL